MSIRISPDSGNRRGMGGRGEVQLVNGVFKILLKVSA